MISIVYQTCVLMYPKYFLSYIHNGVIMNLCYMCLTTKDVFVFIMFLFLRRIELMMCASICEVRLKSVISGIFFKVVICCAWRKSQDTEIN